MENSTFYFFNNSVKKQLLLIIFGTQNSEEIWQVFIKLPTTQPCEMPKVIFNSKSFCAFTAATGQVLRY